MKGIYEFYWDCGRQGDLSGIFVTNKASVAKLIGKEVYFGEVLGKHSEVYGTIKEKDIELKSDDQVFIAQFEAIMGENFESGTNPLGYYDDPQIARDEEDEE